MHFPKYERITICSLITAVGLDWTFGIIVWTFLWALDSIIESQVKHTKPH